VDVWRELAWKYRDTTYQSLALEEAEDWESRRVDRIERIRGPENAIVFARGLVEHNSGSKLHARHLIRLGDLFAAVARRERSRAKSGLFDAARYESFLDQALASYELAEDERKPDLRSLAASKILALIAFHQENLRRAP